MKLKTRIQSEVSTVRELLVAMAAQTGSQALQDLVVERLASTPPVALARLWLLKPGESCSRCVENVELLAPLHLSASAGEPNSTDANYHCFALGQGKIGHIAASGEPIHLADNCASSPWISAPEWARREGIRGFGGYPVVAHGETLGALAIFTTTQLSQEGFEWLGTVAHQLAGLLHTLERQAQLTDEVQALKTGRETAPEFTDLAVPLFAGCSSAIKALERQTAITIANREPVFIQGETGTGKGHLARHVLTQRGQFDLPPKEFSCDALHVPAEEQWLKAVGNRNQTVILHKLDLLPHKHAETLHHILQKDPRPDRFVTTAENDLAGWREEHPDLFHTLVVLRLATLPLRERSEDIPEVLETLLGTLPHPPDLSATEREWISRQPWRGNLPSLVAWLGYRRLEGPLGASTKLPDQVLTEAEFEKLERTNLRRALARTGGRISGPRGAARLLGIPSTTLSSRLKTLGISPEKSKKAHK